MNDSKVLNETTNPLVETPLDKKEEVVTSVDSISDTTQTEKEVETTKDSSTQEDVKEEGATKDVIDLKYIKESLAYDVMSTPTVSSHEYRLIIYIILWARRNNIKYEFDEYGNIYLTKGELNEGEYYPCVTSHLDTVQSEQLVWAQVGLPLEIKTKVNTSGKHEWHVDGMGIGADCKSGVVIALSLFEHFDKIKACFFREEEIGCKGSNNLVKEWFNNVGYVIGWDSPELNRAAWSCSGIKLFDKKFFTENIQEVCKKHGLTKFNAEPFTDVKVIREKTDIICMNFGNGGYNAHMPTEYCVVEEMDHACGMGIDIIKKLGNKQYLLSSKDSYGRYVTREDGTRYWERTDDSDFFRELSGIKTYGTYGGYNYNSNYNSNKSTSVSQTTQKKEDVNTVKVETLEYVSEIYETRIQDIKSQIEKKCVELGISFDEFKEIFNVVIKF